MEEMLTFDEKNRIACYLATMTDTIVTGEEELSGGATRTTHYDAVGWASWDSVEVALNEGDL